MAAAHPEISFSTAGYLRDNPHVINTFVARIEECVNEVKADTGLMADFQARLARGEVDIHHHHAEFQPEGEGEHHHDHDHDHDHDHSHGHSHSHGGHGHHHAPYVHIAHPFGPRTMIDENVCCCFMGQFPDEVVAEERANKKAAGIAVPEQTPQCKVS